MSNHSKSTQTVNRNQNTPVVFETLEARLVLHDGRFFLVARGIEVEITRGQAQLISIGSSGFMIDLDCHRLDTRIYGKELAERMHQAFEERQHDDFSGAVRAAIVLLVEDQP